MQMRKYCYENGTLDQRVADLRAGAAECRRRGFAGIADANDELADWMLDERDRARAKAEARRHRDPNGRRDESG